VIEMQKKLVLRKEGDVERRGNRVRVLWKGGGIIYYDEEVVGGVAT